MKDNLTGAISELARTIAPYNVNSTRPDEIKAALHVLVDQILAMGERERVPDDRDQRPRSSCPSQGAAPMTDEIEVTQADRDAAKSILWVETLIDDEEQIAQAFTRHRRAALLEGIRLGLEAAAQEAGAWKRSGRILEEIEGLNPEEIVRRKS